MRHGALLLGAAAAAALAGASPCAFAPAQPPLGRGLLILRGPATRALVSTSGLRVGVAAEVGLCAQMPQNVYVLVKDPVTPRKGNKSPLRITPVEPDDRLSSLAEEALRGPGDDARAAMQLLSEMPVAIEFGPLADMRSFVMPGDIEVQVRERERAAAGHGGALWGSGIGLSIFLSLNRSLLIEGKTILELGSGVGLRCVAPHSSHILNGKRRLTLPACAAVSHAQKEAREQPYQIGVRDRASRT